MSESAASPPSPSLLKRVWYSTSRNPIIYKEFRSRMRQRRAVLFIILPLLGAAGLILLVTLAAIDNISQANFETQRRIGQVIFFIMVGIQAAITMLIAPAVSAGTLAAEHEHQTYELLRTTLLSARGLVWGKFVASVSFILLLLLLQVPLLSIAFIFGGIEPEEILVHTIVNIFSTLYFCSIGIFVSSLNRRSLPATIGSYIFANAIGVFLPLVILFLGTLFFGLQDPAQYSLPVEILIIAGGLILVALSPPATMLASEIFLQDGNLWYVSNTLQNNTILYLPAPWLIFIFITLATTALFLWLTVRRVSRKDR